MNKKIDGFTCCFCVAFVEHFGQKKRRISGKECDGKNVGLEWICWALNKSSKHSLVFIFIFMFENDGRSYCWMFVFIYCV